MFVNPEKQEVRGIEISANHLKSILSNDPSSRPTVDELIEYIKTWMEEPNNE